MTFLFLFVLFFAFICFRLINTIAHILLLLFSVNKLISMSRQRYNIKTLLSRVLKNIFMVDIQKVLQNALTIRP